MGNKVVIVGGVAGGATAAARLRRLDETLEIVLFERGDAISFANCGLPYYVGDTIPNRESLVLQTPESFRERFNVDVRVLNEVTGIDRPAKTLTVRRLATGETYTETYGRLLLAPGAAVLRPPIEGLSETEGNVFTLRTIPDADAIRAYIVAHAPRRAVIIGGGFIGLEMAENLHERGMDVTVVEMLDQVLAPIDFEMAAIVQNHLRDRGVRLILGDGIAAFRDGGRKVALKSGHELPTDMTILSIGVRPENALATAAGLEVGERGGICVDECLRTTLDASIFAIGDAVQIRDIITDTHTQVPLAGPANRQGRIAADNIVASFASPGAPLTPYIGVMGTAVAKVFDLTVATVGLNEKLLRLKQIEYSAIHVHPQSHAGYYPGATPLCLKLLYRPDTGAICGAQCVGADSVEKHIDIIATAIRGGLRADELAELELAYAPPYSSAKSPVNMLGYIANNLRTETVRTCQWHEVDTRSPDTVLLDIRESQETDMGTIDGAQNIALNDLRHSLHQLPADVPIIVFCAVGQRGYNAARILMQHGFNVRNLDGGYRTYLAVKHDQEARSAMYLAPKIEDTKPTISTPPAPTQGAKIVKIDACGLQCPGPIMKVAAAMKAMVAGEVLEVTTTDPGFVRDIGAWCAKTGNTLIDTHQDGKKITAVMAKGTGEMSIAEAAQCNLAGANAAGKDGSTLVVFSGDLDKAMAAFIIASGAAAMGKNVSMFFTFWGLNILKKRGVHISKPPMDTMFGMMMPAHAGALSLSKMNMGGLGTAMMKKVMRDKNVDSLETLMSNAQQIGVKFIACAMSMDVMGIKPEELIDGVEIGGVAAYLSDASDSNINLFI